jgi:HlyD family secretion protein
MISEMAAPPTTGQQTVSRWLPAVVVVLLAIGIASIYEHSRSRTEVRVISPAYRDIELTVSAVGTVVPTNDFPARATFSGLVDGIFVHLGQHVRPGQLLFTIKDQYAQPRIDNAKVALDDAEVAANNVEHNGSQEDRIAFQNDLVKMKGERDQAARALAAIKQLEPAGSVSGSEVEAATERLRVAQANLDALQQRLTNRYSPEDRASWKDRVAAQKASLQAEKVSWANAHVTSPIAGTVYVLPVRLYDFVPAGGDLMHVADLSHVQIRADFEAADVGKLNIGQPATITWEGDPGHVWHGHVAAKPMAVTRAGDRSVGQCIIALDDDHGDMPIDTDVTVTVSVEKRAHVLAIPREALHSEGPEHFVYRVKGGELERVPVETGLANAMDAEITRGLTPQDLVALHSMTDEKLVDNMRVTTVK